MLYIKDISLESIDYYRIQIVHKSFDKKRKFVRMTIWRFGRRKSIAFLGFSEESIVQERVRNNYCLIDGFDI